MGIVLPTKVFDQGVLCISDYPNPEMKTIDDDSEVVREEANETKNETNFVVMIQFSGPLLEGEMKMNPNLDIERTVRQFVRLNATSDELEVSSRKVGNVTWTWQPRRKRNERGTDLAQATSSIASSFQYKCYDRST